MKRFFLIVILFQIPPSFAEQSMDIAFVKPVFTSSAYQNEGFYDFYRKFSGTIGSVYAFTRYLNVSVVDHWKWSEGLGKFAESFEMKRFLKEQNLKSKIINDIDVHKGSIQYRLLVVGFDEYVTQQQYDNYKKFLERGGKIILFDPTHFLAEVAYDEKTNTIRLVKGHGWESNGLFANPSVYHRWEKENVEIYGGNYVNYRMGTINGAVANTTHPLSLKLQERYGKTPLFTVYHSHEENNMTNPLAKPIAYWQVEGVQRNVKIAIYEHVFKKGSVIATSVFGSQLVEEEDFRNFLFEAIKYLLKEKISRAEETRPENKTAQMITQNTTTIHPDKPTERISLPLQLIIIAIISIGIWTVAERKLRKVGKTSLFLFYS